MKRFIAWFLALILLAAALPVQAETWYVYTKNGKTLNLRDEYTNKVIGNIPYGTALEPDTGKSTEKAAYVTYKGKSGFVKWEFLQKTKPKPRKKTTEKASSEGVPYQANSGVPYQGQQAASFQITARGAYIQYASGTKGAGDKWASLRVSPSDTVVITADVPKGKKIDYWVINGVQYDFNETVKTIRLTKADADFTLEAVYKNAGSETLLSPQAIQDARTGERLLVKTINAQMCHLTRTDKGAGGWMKEFDFTDDYQNRASGEWETGGQVTARVKATIPKNKKVRGWKFNETELYPNSTVTHFIVRTLNAEMTYEPIFGTKKTTAEPPRQPDERITTPEQEIYCTVTCRGCTFSGGGYTNATSGKVKAGTKITVHTDYGGGVSKWTVNGTTLMRATKVGKKTIRETSTANSFSKTINQDTSIVCIMKIN